MYYPKTYITKTWYQYNPLADEQVVIERYGTDPNSSVRASVCAGYDNDGKIIADEELAKIFPHIKVEYYIKRRTACTGDEAEDVCDENGYKFQYKASGNDCSYSDDKTGADKRTSYLWLDMMINDGDAICTTSDGDINGKNVCFQYKGQEDGDIPADDVPDNYSDRYYMDINEKIMEGLVNGDTVDDVLATLPWYIRREKDHVKVGGEWREIIYSKVNSPACQNGEAHSIDICEKLSNAELSASVSEELNRMVYEYAKNLHETVSPRAETSEPSTVPQTEEGHVPVTFKWNGTGDVKAFESKLSHAEGEHGGQMEQGNTP